MRNICAVHVPMPRTPASMATTSSSPWPRSPAGSDMLSPLSLARSGLCRLGREPQRAGVDPVRVNRQHLPVEFLRGGGFLVEPVEVADVLSGFIDDPRVVAVAVAFVAGYDGTRIECLDGVEGREPVRSALRV